MDRQLGVALSTRGRRKDISRDRCKKRLGLPKQENRYSTVRWDYRGFRRRHTNNSNVGSPKCLFEIGPHHIIYLLGLPGETVFWNRRIIIDRLGLLEQALVQGSWNKLLGSLDIVISFRAAGTGFWDRWIPSSRLGLHRSITSGVAEHHRRLGLGEHSFRGHCTIIVCIARRTSASSGVARAFRQTLFCSSTTRLLCTGRAAETW